MTYGDLLDLAKSSPKYVRKVRKMRKRWIKLLERMEADMNTVYKDPLAYEVIVELTNQDLAWPGDFDSIRGELANLMDKLLTVEAFPDEVHELAIALTYMKQVGSR
jgi:hypothetical protein